MITYTILFDDYKNALKLHTGFRVAMIKFVILMCLAGIFITIGMATCTLEWDFIFMSLSGFAVIFFILLPMLSNIQYHKIYDQQKSLHEEVSITFDDSAIEVTSESGKFKMRWCDIYKYKSNDKIILLYESKNLMRIIKKGGFHDSRILDAFLSKLQSSTPRKY